MFETNNSLFLNNKFKGNFINKKKYFQNRFFLRPNLNLKSLALINFQCNNIVPKKSYKAKNLPIFSGGLSSSYAAQFCVAKNNRIYSFKRNADVLLADQINLTRRYFIIGERRLSNYWWASIILLGGLGFLLTGIGSYFHFNWFNTLLPVTNASKGFSESITEISNNGYSYGVAIKDLNSSISFFPQGLLMCFYGSLGLLLSIYWWLLIYWDVGGGFNEFNKKEGFMRIFRWGYPGKNRRIDLIYSLKDIEAIRVQYKESQSLFASDQTIYVKLRANSNKKNGIKENFEIPLGGIGQPLTLKEIEKQASELANFLQVSLEGL